MNELLEQWKQKRIEAEKQKENVLAQINSIMGYIQACDEMIALIEAKIEVRTDA